MAWHHNSKDSLADLFSDVSLSIMISIICKQQNEGWFNSFGDKNSKIGMRYKLGNFYHIACRREPKLFTALAPCSGNLNIQKKKLPSRSSIFQKCKCWLRLFWQCYFRANFTAPLKQAVEREPVEAVSLSNQACKTPKLFRTIVVEYKVGKI